MGAKSLLDTLYSQIGAVAWLAVCFFALWKGDQPERFGATALLVAWIATLAAHRDTQLDTVHYPVMAIDAALLLVLIGLSWKVDRAWPLWAAGFQLITVLVHVVTMVDLRIHSIAYLSALTISSYGLLICLGVGTFWAWQEREAIKPPD